MMIPVAGFETNLTTRITTSSTDIAVASMTDDDGNSLTNGSQYGLIIDEGQPDEEFIIGTADVSGLQFTSCLRGVSVSDGSTEVSARKKAHRKNATIKITDHPYMVLAARILNGTDAAGGVLKLPSTRTISNSRHVVDKEYVDAAATAAGGITAFQVTQNGADPSLTVNIGAGYLNSGTEVISFAGASAQAVTNGATNYVQLDWNGGVLINTTGFVEGYIPLAEVVAAGGDITGITDRRAWLSSNGANDKLITDRYAYGETITAGQLVYLDTATSKWKLADADSTSSALTAFAIALDSGVLNDTGKRVQVGGIVTGLTGLTVGYVYASNTSGSLTSSAGTNSKVVGYAYTTTTMLLLPSLDIAAIYGATSAWTTVNMTAAMNWWATPYNQPVRRTVTAGENIAQGDLVAMVSGSAYKTNPSAIGTPATSGTTDTTAITNSATASQAIEVSSTVKLHVGNASTRHVSRVVVSPSTGAFTSATETALSTAAAGTFQYMRGVLIDTDKVLVVYSFNNAGVGAIYGKILTLTSGISEGTEAALATALTLDSYQITVEKVSTTEALITYVTTAGGLRYLQVNISGTTISAGSSGAIDSDTAINYTVGLRQFGSSGYYLVIYHWYDGASHYEYGRIFQYSAGAVSNVGSAVQITSTAASAGMYVSMVSIDSTNILMVRSENFDVKAMVLSRSSNTLTVNSALTVDTRLSNNASAPAVINIGGSTYVVSSIDSTSNTSNRGSALWLIKVSGTTVTGIGSRTSIDNGSTSASDWTPFVNKINPTTLLVCHDYYAASDKRRYTTATLTVNYAGYIGIAEAAITSGNTGSVIVAGTTDDISGFTAGPFYTDVGGQPDYTGYGTVVRAGVAESATVAIVK